MSHNDQHIDSYDWYDPQSSDPIRPPKPNTLSVDYSPATVASVDVESTPKPLTSLLSSSSPHPIESVSINTDPVGITVISVTDSPAPPVPFVGVDKSPKWPESTSVESSPKNIDSTEADTDPYPPVSISPATDPYPAESIDVDSSPRNVESVLEDFFTANDPILGLWRYDSEPSDYAILLQTSQESDPADFPEGDNNEILRITKTFTQEGLYSSTTYIETQDAMLGGGEPNQVFDIDDQNILWTYVKFAAVFDPQNHTIYREQTRPPLPPVLCEHIEETVEVESVEVEFSPTSVVSLEAGELSYAITNVSVQSSPKPVELQVVAEINTGVDSISVGLLPEAVSSVTPQSSPKPITSVDPLSSPKDIDSSSVESTPKPLGSFVVDATPATIVSVSGESSPKPITSSEALSTPSAPASISGGTLPYAVSDISIEATPANVVSVLSTDSQPDSVATVTGGAFTISPALVLATDSVPVAVATLDSRVIPNSIVSVDIEYTPKPVVSVVPDLKPVAPAIINSAELGDNSPLAVLVVSSPKPVASVEELELVTPVTSVEVVATPKAVSSISIGSVPLPISTVAIETEPKPVLDVDPLIVEPMVPVATLEVVDLSLFPAAPAEVFISGLFQETPVLRVESLFVESSPKPVAGFSGGDLSEIPIAPVVMVSSFNTTDTGTGTGAPGTVAGTGPLTGGYAPSRPTAVGAQSDPKNIAEVEVLELAAHPPLTVEVEYSPSPVSGVLPVNNSAAPTAPEVLQVIGVIVEVIREAIPEPPQVIQVTAVLYPTRYVDPPFQPSVLYADIKCEPVSFLDATDKPPTPVSFFDATNSAPNAPSKVTGTDDSLPPDAVDNVSVIYAYVIDGGSVIEKFYVSGGQLSAPYYTFTDQFGNPVDFQDVQLRPGRSFVFEAANDFNTNHPMSIGTYQDGAWVPLDYVNGVSLAAVGDQIGFTLPEDFDADTNNIGFYCSIHLSVMNGSFPITEEPKIEGGGTGASGDGPDGATGSLDGGGGTDAGIFEQASIPLRISVDSTPFKPASITPRDISIPLEMPSVDVEIFYPAEGSWSPAEEFYDSKGDDYYAWWDSSELVDGIPSWHPSVPVGSLGDGYSGSSGNTGNYLIYGSDPMDQNPDDIDTVVGGNGLSNRFRVYGGYNYPRTGANYLALANNAGCPSSYNDTPATRSDYDQSISPWNMEQIFLIKLDDPNSVPFLNSTLHRATVITFDDDGLVGDRNDSANGGSNLCVVDGATRHEIFISHQRITLRFERRNGINLEVYEHSHDIELPTNKPIILGARRSSDLTKHEEVQSNGGLYTETYRKLHISVNGTEVIAFDLYTIPNSGNTTSFWNGGLVADGIDSAVLGDTRFIIQNLEYPGDYSDAELDFWRTDDPWTNQATGVGTGIISDPGMGYVYVNTLGDQFTTNKHIDSFEISRVSTDNVGVSIIVHAGSPVFPAVPNGDSFVNTVYPLKTTENGVPDVNSVSAYIASSDETHEIVQEIFFTSDYINCYSRDQGVTWECRDFGDSARMLTHMIIFEKDGQYYSVYGHKFNIGEYSQYSFATGIGDTPSDAGYPSTAYVGDIFMVGQKLNLTSVTDARIPVSYVNVGAFELTDPVTSVDVDSSPKTPASIDAGSFTNPISFVDATDSPPEQITSLNVSDVINLQLSSEVDLEMIWVEPGTFTMGYYNDDYPAARPQHEVTLTKGFYLGKYEFTQAQYEAVMTGNTDGLSATPSAWPNNPNRPVERVSYTDLQKFLTRLNSLQAGNIPAGWEYALPTEAQWEYACRAGTTTPYSWGDTISFGDANYAYNGNGTGLQQTTDVGQYPPNPWGFYDMHGNVWEITSDAHTWEGYPTTGPRTDPYDPGTASTDPRSCRGGSWKEYGVLGSDLRSAIRLPITPVYRDSRFGFRVALKQI